VRGQAEHIAGLISLASLILLAYVAGNTALELQRLGSQIAGEVLASKELLEVIRANETHIEIRSRWDGDSLIEYLILCDAYACNITSADTYVPRRRSAVVALLNGSSVANQVCVITANENMFCTDSNIASTQESNQAPPQPRRAWYVAERVPPTYIVRPEGTPNGTTYGDYNVTRMWKWRLSKYPLVSNEGLYIYAYPADRAFFATELDDLLPTLPLVVSNSSPQFPSQGGLIWINYNLIGGPFVLSDVANMFDHDDSTPTNISVPNPRTVFVIDLGQVYTNGVFFIYITFDPRYLPAPSSTAVYATLYFGAELWNPTASSDVLAVIVPVFGYRTYTGGALAYWIDSIPGGVRYIWLNASGVVIDIYSVEFYPPSALKPYIIATNPLVPQGLDVYPRTVMALAVPGTSLRIIEET